MDSFQALFGKDGVEWCSSALETAQDADALCLLTEWDEFAAVDLLRLQNVLKQPILIDGRNVFKEENLLGTDFIYYSVGRPNLNQGVKQPMPVL
jgi:UDPglucose 6-dehydrogenase